MQKNTFKNILIFGGLVLVAATMVSYFSYNRVNDNQTPNSASVSSTDTNSLNTTQAILPQGEPSIGATTAKPVDNSLKNNKHMVTIETNYGTIQFETYDADAPKTVNNFITLAQKGFYDNLIFHRIIRGFMIQGGDPKGTGTGGPGYQFEDELNSTTDSYKAGYQKGVVAMANAGPNTNGSQFFIMLADYPLPNNYTIFGKVVKGQEVVDKIGSVKTGIGDRPDSPVIMKKVVVEVK